MLSADGCVDVLVPDDVSCCPPPLCGNDLCCTFVAFFQLLPSGPLWDYWKQAAISYFQRSDDPAECPLLNDPQCPSLILHAIYTVLKLRGVVHGALWPALRESNPYTAVTTLDYHLERLQWENCYASQCRSMALGPLSPLEVMGVCGPVYCEPPFPPELVAALKRGIAISLTRANMGVIKNLCGINWVIEPLGAEIMPIYASPLPDPCPPDPPPEGCEPNPPEDVDLTCLETDCDPFDCESAKQFYLCQSRDWLQGVGTGDVCESNVPIRVPAWFEWPCYTDKVAGMPDIIWPGVLAAECIIRSLLPCSGAGITITRCCEIGEEAPS
ncbi:hypothetical protein CQ14_06880 [Bradyrhizobium lablabi]|uniref:Uncharacterized protein n=1 Tax=Bradyrhizobium lablabi TaxID=722472 RepID=A0A0R3MM38_9BRAD|nr:hypothetical protein [Bradyrhizobium lablabi]KRR21368.1 hypothetical protein CQ14_06880 [Bradyrhizobium lablabi]